MSRTDKTRPQADCLTGAEGTMVRVLGRSWGGSENVIARLTPEQAEELAAELTFAAAEARANRAEAVA